MKWWNFGVIKDIWSGSLTVTHQAGSRVRPYQRPSGRLYGFSKTVGTTEGNYPRATVCTYVFSVSPRVGDSSSACTFRHPGYPSRTHHCTPSSRSRGSMSPRPRNSLSAPSEIRTSFYRRRNQRAPTPPTSPRIRQHHQLQSNPQRSPGRRLFHQARRLPSPRLHLCTIHPPHPPGFRKRQIRLERPRFRGRGNPRLGLAPLRTPLARLLCPLRDQIRGRIILRPRLPSIPFHHHQMAFRVRRYHRSHPLPPRHNRYGNGGRIATRAPPHWMDFKPRTTECCVVFGEAVTTGLETRRGMV